MTHILGVQFNGERAEDPFEVSRVIPDPRRAGRDAASRPVAVASGFVSLDLPTGVHQVQVEMPGTIRERLVVVEPGRLASV